MTPKRRTLFPVLVAVLLAGFGTLILQADTLWSIPAAEGAGSSLGNADGGAAGALPAGPDSGPNPGPDPAAGAGAGANDGAGGTFPGTGKVGLGKYLGSGDLQDGIYPGEPDREARLVDQEDARLIYVRTVASAARWRVDGLEGAYRLRTGSTYTLVLPARAEAYTQADLATLTPQGFVKQADGGYLLSENVVVLAGASLSLVAPDGPEGLDIRLASGPDYFVSIVALGGSLTLSGSATTDVRITSWNSEAYAADTLTADGRAYIRVLDGHASLARAQISHLGFWSGNTGGLSLTGTDEVGTFPGGPPALPSAPKAPEAPATGARVLPEEALASWTEQAEQNYSVVTAGIDDVTIKGNAFGLFVSNGRDIAIEDTAISGSLVDGLVLHRAVTDTEIIRTSSSHNAVDGFTVGSSTTGIHLKDVTAEGNVRNGISLDGRPLAAGPNAVGTPVQTYGGNRVTGSTVEANGRYGIELSGGTDLEVENNFITGNEVGVVVNHGATGVGISRNEFRNQRLQAVAVRDEDASAAVYGNTIRGGDTGIYVRNATAQVSANIMESISNHGITLVGDVSNTTVTGNTVSGHGSTAIAAKQSAGAMVTGNNLLDWTPAYTVERAVSSVSQPLTLIWFLLGGLLLVTALTRGKNAARIGSPYAERVPLTSLSRGFVVPDDAAGSRP